MVVLEKREDKDSPETRTIERAAIPRGVASATIESFS